MELTFKDNTAADLQDRACSILLSLSMIYFSNGFV